MTYVFSRKELSEMQQAMSSRSSQQHHQPDAMIPFQEDRPPQIQNGIMKNGDWQDRPRTAGTSSGNARNGCRSVGELGE